MENKTTVEFTCFKCKEKNEFHPDEYAKKSKKLLLEMKTTTRTVTVKCRKCREENKITIAQN